MTSTDNFGNPDWVLSSLDVLVSQERQQLLLENSSSRGDVEGRQSYSSPQVDMFFLPALVAAVGAAAGGSRLRPPALATENAAICTTCKRTVSAQESLRAT